MAAPASRIGPLTDAERAELLKTSVVAGIYDKTEDRESAFEVLRARTAAEAAAANEEDATEAGSGKGKGGARRADAPADDGWGGAIMGSLGGLLGGSGRKDSIIETAAKSVARTLGSSLGRAIVRGLLGGIRKTR